MTGGGGVGAGSLDRTDSGIHEVELMASRTWTAAMSTYLSTCSATATECCLSWPGMLASCEKRGHEVSTGHPSTRCGLSFEG